MIVRLTITWALAVGVIGGTGYYLFPWFTLTAVGILAVFSALAGLIAVVILRATGYIQTGGGRAGQTASYESKGARRQK